MGRQIVHFSVLWVANYQTLRITGLKYGKRVDLGNGDSTIRTSTFPGTPFTWFTIRTNSVIRTLKVRISDTSVSVVRIAGPQWI